MGCGCNQRITSWYDLQNTEPKNPFEIISYALFDATVGTLLYSTAFIHDGGTWSTSPITVGAASSSSVSAWNTTDDSGSAAQWSAQNQMTNNASDLATPLKSLVFLKAGNQWKNTIPLTFGSACTYLEVSFLDNAGTKGDDEGAVPVIRFEGPITAAAHILVLTTKMPGEILLGLRTEVTSSGDDSMLQLRCIMT